MDRQAIRKIRYYVRLHYPLSVIAMERGFYGKFPDLPGCEQVDDDLPVLYASLERLRREWIAERVAGGRSVPLPNSQQAPAEPAPTAMPRPHAQHIPARPVASL